MKIAKKYTLGLEAWEILEQLNDLLKPFELTTKIISSEKYPTSSLVLPLLASFTDIFLHIEENQDEEIQHFTDEEEDNSRQEINAIDAFKKILKVSFKNRFDNKSIILNLATFLDIRYKKYVQMSPALRQAIEEEYTIAEVGTKIDGDNDKVIKKKSALDIIFPTDNEENLSEIDCYLNENSIPKESDVLLWWKHNSTRYPVLSKLAKKYLCVSATSVPSERVFSSAGNIISTKRCSLSNNKAKKLIFLFQNQ